MRSAGSSSSSPDRCWAYLTQTSGDIRVEDVRFAGANGNTMSALLYIPPNATASTPAPGILAVHGYINSRETQDGFAIEFARRGYVVLALDQTGHGYSDPPAFANGFGGPDGLKYLRGLDMVDMANIGLEGHSMGGWTILAAANAYAGRLQGDGAGGLGHRHAIRAAGRPGLSAQPRGGLQPFRRVQPADVDVDHAQDVTSSPKLLKLFGRPPPPNPARSTARSPHGSARVLYTPTTTHPGDHISPKPSAMRRIGSAGP